MRILQWAMPYLPVMGGREVFVQRLATTLAERGHEVLVVAPEVVEGTAAYGSGDDALSPFRVVRIPVRLAFEGQDADELHVARSGLAKALTAFTPDVCHAHAIAPDLFIWREAARTLRAPVPLVLTDHGVIAATDVGSLAVTRLAAATADVLVAVSASAASGLARALPSLRDRITLIRNGVPLPSRPTPADPRSRQVLAYGRLSSEKGFATLLVAWSVLVRDDPSLRLVLAGDGRERQGLVRLVEHLGIGESVAFAGWIGEQQVQQYLAGSILVVVPSLWAEPFGLVAAEAAAAGRAVIASRTGALPEIVSDGTTGRLFAAGDILGLVSVLKDALSDPDGTARMGLAARARAVEDFDWEACVTAHEAVYRRVAGDGSR